MENLILQAIGYSESEKINTIKRNKEFLKRLIDDLQQVYTLYVANVNGTDSTTYRIRKNSHLIESVFFTADENGCIFRTQMLGYRIGARPEWNLGWIAEKYDTCKGDSRFMANNSQPYGNIDVKIKFTDASENLMDILKDITRILDHEKFAKNFN